MLAWTIYLSFAGAVLLALMPKDKNDLSRWIALAVAAAGLSLAVAGFVAGMGQVLFAVGGAVGLALALAMMRVLGSILDALAQATQTSASDPAILVGAPALLVGLALAASSIPARKAILVDPSTALRTE